MTKASTGSRGAAQSHGTGASGAPGGQASSGDTWDGTGVSRRRAGFARVHPWVTLALRLVLAGVLGYAGLLKVGDPLASTRAVRAYQLLPESVVKPVGYGLPFLEIALAVLLVVGLAVRVSGILSGLLMLAFIVAIISVWVRGISIDCGCFGGGGEVDASQTKYPQEILRDVGLVAASAWLAIFPSGRFALDGRILGDPIGSDR